MPRRANRRPVSRRWWLLAPLVVLILPPMLDLMAGHRTQGDGPCRLVSVVDGNTLLLRCEEPAAPMQGLSLASVLVPPQSVRPVAASGGVIAVDLLGVSGPPVLGARCLTEAWAGLRARMALRSRIWLAGALDFQIRSGSGAALALVTADGQPLNSALRRAPVDPCPV